MIGTFILVAGLVQSIFLFFFFLRAFFQGQRSLLISIFFLFISWILILLLVLYTREIQEYPHLLKTGYFIGALVAPLFSLAIHEYFGVPNEKKYISILQFLPSAGILIYNMPFYLLDSESKKLLFQNTDFHNLFIDWNLLNLFSLVSNFLILLRVYYRFKLFSKEFPLKATSELITFKNYTILILLWTMIFIFLIIIDPGGETESLVYVGFAFWVIGFSWHRIFSENIQPTVERNGIETIVEKDINSKYNKSNLAENTITELGQKLDLFFSSEEFFQISELSLVDIALKLKVSNHVASQVINRYYNKGFYQLLRDIRIERAMNLLKNGDLPITRVCYDSGFNSKNTFLRAFRESTGFTPSEYRDKFHLDGS